MQNIVLAFLFGTTASLLAIGAVSGQTAGEGGWRSPRALTESWPRLGGGECAAYGARYGYVECNRKPAAQKVAVRRKSAKLAAAVKPKPQPAMKAVRAAKAARIKPPAKAPRMARKPILAASFKRQPRAPSCEAKMNACYASCFAARRAAVECNESCSTGETCRIGLQLNYAQFLALQYELSKFTRR